MPRAGLYISTFREFSKRGSSRPRTTNTLTAFDGGPVHFVHAWRILEARKFALRLNDWNPSPSAATTALSFIPLPLSFRSSRAPRSKIEGKHDPRSRFTSFPNHEHGFILHPFSLILSKRHASRARFCSDTNTNTTLSPPLSRSFPAPPLARNPPTRVEYKNFF